MRLEWLEDILAVAEAGSLSVAAERRHLTQSAFSRRIQFIEGQLGVQLFDRTRKPIRLLAAARDQIDEIGRVAGSLRQLQNDLRLDDRRSRNRVVIASQHALTTSLTPRVVKALESREGGIYVRLRSANLDECFSLLLSRQADVALVYKQPSEEHPIEADYLETLTIASDRLIPVAAGGLAARAASALDGAEVPVIAYPSDVFLGRILARYIRPALGAGLRPRPKAETALTLAALEMAAIELGVAWVPRSLAADHLRRGRLEDLSGALPACDLDITAVRLARGSSPAEIALWETLSSGLSGLQDG